MKKRFVLFFVVACLLLQFIQIPAWADTLTSTGSFVFQITTPRNSEIDLTGIELRIYAEQDTTEYEDGVVAIDEEYTYSVYPNANGIVRFDPPASSFSVNINLATLPNGWGAETYTRHYSSMNRSGQIGIREIASAEIVESDNQYTVAAYDENGFPLAVDIEIEAEPIAVPMAISKDLFSSYQAIHSVDCIVTARVGDMQLSKHVTESIRNLSAIDKCRYLYDLSLIDQSQYVRSLCEAIRSEDDWGDEEECGTSVIGEILAYAETMSGDDSNYEYISAVAEDELTPPSYETEHIYYPSSSSSFYIHYGYTTGNEKAGSLQVARAVYVEMVKIYTYLCNQAGFRVPQGKYSGRYDVYIVGDSYIDAPANTPGIGNKSIIQLKNSFANSLVGTDDAKTNRIASDIAHEYMHAIMYSYGVKFGTNDQKFMHESFASFIGSVYSVARDYSSLTAFLKDFTASTSYKCEAEYAAVVKDYVGFFINYLDYSLSNVSYKRNYGALLYPLYLCQYTNGIGIIITILEHYSQFNDPIKTIDQIIPFSTVFSGFSAACYQPKESFKIYAENWRDTAQTKSTVNVGSSSTITDRIITNPLSCYYLSYSTKLSGKLSITTTLTNYNSSSIPVSIIMRYRGASDSSYRGSTTKMSSTQLVVTLTGFGGTYPNVAVGFANCSMESNITFYQTASVTSASSASLPSIPEKRLNAIQQIGI